MQRLRAVLLPHLEAVIGPSGEGLEWPELLTEPTDGTQGDLALPCFIFARALRQAPASIAEAFAQALRERIPSDVLESIQASNGYLNVRASSIWIASNVLASAREHGERYGCLDATEEEYLVEHTSRIRTVHSTSVERGTPSSATHSSVCSGWRGTRSGRSTTWMTSENRLRSSLVARASDVLVDRILEADGRKPSGQWTLGRRRPIHPSPMVPSGESPRKEEASVDEGVADLIHRSETGDDPPSVPLRRPTSLCWMGC